MFLENLFISVEKLENESIHEIMAVSVLRKPIFQTCIRSHQLALDIRFLRRLFVFIYTSCVQTVEVLVRLRGCSGSHKPSLFLHVIIQLSHDVSQIITV